MTAPSATADLEKRVAAGACELDRRTPGWAAHVDPDVLDLDCYDDCVVGQLQPHYPEALDGFDREDATLGFYAPSQPELGELAELWRGEVLRRRAETSDR